MSRRTVCAFVRWLTISATMAALAVALVSTGCSSQEEPADSTAQIAGTVTVNGKPVKKGTILFLPSQAGNMGEASLDMAGKFELASPLVPGKYRVFFSDAPVPEKFQSETSSDYTVTINSGANVLEIDLN